MGKCTSKRYEVVFVPSFDKVSSRNRSTAQHKGKFEFTLSTAERVAKKLKNRGDKAIKIRCAR